jgi:hypothetical protein
MMRPRVADGGDGLRTRRVAANMLNKQSRIADSGWSSSLGDGRGANDSPNIKLEVCYETLHSASEKDRLLGTT